MRVTEDAQIIMKAALDAALPDTAVKKGADRASPVQGKADPGGHRQGRLANGLGRLACFRGAR